MEKEKNEVPKLHLRGGFSDRNGIAEEPKTIQIREFNKRTRVAFVNAINKLFSELFSGGINYAGRYTIIVFYDDLLSQVYSETTDSICCDIFNHSWLFNRYIKSVLLTSKYHDVLTLIEYIIRWSRCKIGEDNPNRSRMLYGRDYEVRLINQVFEQEFVGYRFIEDCITPITDENEVKAITESFDLCCDEKFSGCRNQMLKALKFLSDRETPDYKNSIKESIGAIETICKIIVENDKVTLATALNDLEKNGIIDHPALKESICKLYGYASDVGGIRHGEKSKKSKVAFEDAKFILVTCSALLNYLIAKYGKRNEE